MAGYIDAVIGDVKRVTREDVESVLVLVLNRRGVEQWWDKVFPVDPYVQKELQGKTPNQVWQDNDPVVKKILVDRVVDYLSPSFC